jgi:hypothetical protein
MSDQPDASPTGAGRGPRLIRDTTRNLIHSVLLDVWPRHAAIVDFGINTQEHYEALYYPLKHGDFTPEQLDAAMGNGRMLTELVNAAPHNPHKGIVFITSWDELMKEPAGSSGAAELDTGASDKHSLLRRAFDLATEAGYHGFRREYFNDPEAIKEWPDPATRERELRASWHELRDYPAFEQSHAGEDVESLIRYVGMLREEVAKGEASDFYERAQALGRAARSAPADQPTLSEIAKARPAERQATAGITLADSGIEK